MQLTFDVFSGRPNPSWRLPSIIAQRIFNFVNDMRLLRRHTPTSPGHLGYRATQLVLPAEMAVKYQVPTWLNLSSSAADHTALFKELLAIAWAANFSGHQELDKLVRLISSSAAALPPGGSRPHSAKPARPCAFEKLKFDPAPWNALPVVKTNNCYAYAANKLAHYPRKPQPGAASGKTLSLPLTGAKVKAFAKLDGAHDVHDCFPESEAPRLLVALVIWPGHDYHWYRKHPDCWGHKPGASNARNTDENQKVITDPETCNRGPYTEFHGYMLMPKSQRVSV